MKTDNSSTLQSYLDKTQPVRKYTNILPHWFQPEKTQFVTFRLSDSLPQTKLDEIRDAKEAFLRQFPKPWTHETNMKYNKEIGYKADYWLDQGIGSCLLREPEIREIVSSSILHFQDLRYHIHDFVIMPNHVHIEITPFIDIDEIMHSIRSYSAKKINILIHRTGQFWQKSNFDRIERSQQSFEYHRRYIHENPRNLSPDEYTLWSDEKGFIKH